MAATSSQALDYLEQLPGTIHKRLYKQPSTVLAVFRRMLPHLAKTIVMEMLWMTRPYPDADLDVRIRPDARAEKDQAMSVLTRLNIVTLAQETQGPRAWRLASGFSHSLRLALTGGGDHRSFGVPSNTKDRENVDILFLDRYAQGQWEAILYYMVGSAGTGLAGGAAVTEGTKALLKMGHFVEPKGSMTSITQAGFTFLLQEANAQVWSLLIVYLENAPNLQMDPVDVLSFLFMLGSLELGQDYSTANLTATQRQMLEDLTDFGIVYRSSRDSSRFYPTRLATTLTSDAGALLNTSAAVPNSLRGGGAEKGYIIVETNYRLYAYTSSLLQIAVLNLFTRLTARFPNLVSGKLTKESIQRAIASGITSDQIISYLSTHAHPEMQKSMPILPPTVVDQIRLWQLEGDRMKATPGYLIKDLASAQEYEEYWKYAEALGVLVWKNDNKRVFFVNKIEQMGAFIKSKNQRQKGQ